MVDNELKKQIKDIIIWDEKAYDLLNNIIDGFSEEKLKIFSGKLISTKYVLKGVRMNILKTIAKYILCGNYKSFLENVTNLYYELALIKGLVIMQMKAPFCEKIEYIKEYVKLIDNWAICDTCCSSMHIGKDGEEYFEFAKEMLSCANEFEIRFGLVLILAKFVDSKHINEILLLSTNIRSDKFYVQMGNAWLISCCYIKFKKETNEMLQKSELDNFTFNKAIQKCIESFRVSNEDKDILRKMKRKA